MLLKRAIEANLPKKLEWEVDYKALLWKYMSHVEWCEWVNYVKSMDSTNFSQEEIDAANLLNNNPYKYISDYIY